MEQINWLVVLGTGIIPLLTGFVYYHPKVLGNAWMKASGTVPDEANFNPLKIFGLTALFGILLAMGLLPVVLHMTHVMSLVATPGGGQAAPDSAGFVDAQAFLAKYGGNFRTFKHGMFHSVLMGLFVVTPTLGILSLFERKSFKYVAIHVGYYLITLGLMGGLLCAYGIK